MLTFSLGMLSRNDKPPPDTWDTHGISGNVFLQIQWRLLRHLIRNSQILGSLMYQNTQHHMWWVKAKHQLRIRDASQDRQPEIQSFWVEETFQRIIGQTNNDCRFQILILTNSPRKQRLFACWKIRFKTEARTCSQFPAEAALWIKEVELVESVDDLKSSCSVREIQLPNFEGLDAKIASALNRIIHNTRFKRKVSLEEQSPKRGPFPSWKTDRFPDLRVLPGHWSQWFCRELCRPIHNCFSKWWYSGIRFEMGTEFYYQWRKSHLMTSWQDCTN